MKIKIILISTTLTLIFTSQLSQAEQSISKCISFLPFEDQAILRQCIQDKRNGSFEGKCLDLISEDATDTLKACANESSQREMTLLKECSQNLSFQANTNLRGCILNPNMYQEGKSRQEVIQECIDKLPDFERESVVECLNQT